MGTFEGNLYRVDLSKSFIKDSESKLWAVNQPIVDIKVDLTQGELIIFSENQLTFLNLIDQSNNARKVSFKIVGVESLNNQLFIASNKEIFLYDRQSMVALPLESDLLKNEQILTFSFSASTKSSFALLKKSIRIELAKVLFIPINSPSSEYI